MPIVECMPRLCLVREGKKGREMMKEKVFTKLNSRAPDLISHDM